MAQTSILRLRTLGEPQLNLAQIFYQNSAKTDTKTYEMHKIEPLTVKSGIKSQNAKK